MKTLLARSLAAKILAVFIPLLVVAQMSVLAFQTWTYYQNQKGELVKRLHVIAESQAAALAPAAWEFDQSEMQNVLDQMGKLPFLSSVVILDPGGQELASTGDMEAPVENPTFRVERPMIYEPDVQPQNVGRIIVTVHSKLILRDVVERTKANLIILLVLIASLAAGAVGATRYFIGRPLGLMRASIEQARRGHERKAVDWQSSDELGVVVQSYNEILVLEKEAIGRLQEQQENLEMLVEERTRDMAAARDEADVARRRSEAAEAVLKDAIESISDAFILYDENDKLVIFNEQYKRMAPLIADIIKPGVSFATLMETAQQRREAAGEGEASRQLIQEIIDEHRHPSGNSRLRQMSDGDWYQVREHRTSSGGIVAIRTNITELKEARDAAEQAAVTKAAFLATMSHEIRTPMNGVIGMVDLLVQTKLQEDQRQMLSTVRDSGYALLTIINDILDFSKIEAGKLELEQIPFSICDGLEGVSETLASNARTKGIQLNIHVDPHIPDAVLGDQVRLRQILFNIGGNAIKFTEKGRVLFRAYRVATDADEMATVRFEIIDSGIGISEEARVDLFKEFSQAESSTTRRFGGTGLGLSISQRLIEMMGGKIEVESELGKGSTFIVTLNFPIAPKHEVKSDGYDLSGLKVLFVGDNAEERKLDAGYLRHWGAEVTTTGDLEKVKSLALAANKGETPYNIIVLGSAWPIKVQVKAVQGMLNEDALSGLKFVLMTKTRTKTERVDLINTVYVESDPLKRAPFIRGVAVAAGRASPEVIFDDDDMPSAPVKTQSIAEATTAGTLIMVAEDNLTNQDVIGRQLKLLGYAAEFYDDGKQALAAWRTKSYALLLTDCHMPVMDGFELTQSIRASEKGGMRRSPIVAITASALKAEADRCFESGMDDFLAKPLEMPKLREVLIKWMPQVQGEVEPVAPQIESPKLDTAAGSPIDASALKNVFGDDDETFKEILVDFVQPAQDNVAEIMEAFAAKSADGVAKAAHKLKSSSRAVGANDLSDLCLALETAGKGDDWGAIKAAAPKLEGVLAQVIDYINRL